jgi:hypothetical protein
VGSRCVCCLLDLDLADELDPELQRLARAAATAQTVEINPGRGEGTPCLKRL